jgi:hypothetical protein
MRYLTVEELNTFSDSPWLVDLAHTKCGLRMPSESSCKSQVLFDRRLGIFPK